MSLLEPDWGLTLPTLCGLRVGVKVQGLGLGT